MQPRLEMEEGARVGEEGGWASGAQMLRMLLLAVVPGLASHGQ